jgi:hypothetical protein
MSYFKDETGKVFGFTDEQVEQGYGRGLVALTDLQFQSWQLFNEFDKTEEEIKERLEELKTQEEIDVLYLNLDSLCDKESQEARTTLVGWNVSGEQVARYKEKARIANTDSLHYLLDEEAAERGIETSELAELIKEKATEWDESILIANVRTETFRIKVQTLIKSSRYDEARSAIEARGGK